MNYTDENVIQAVKESNNISEVLRKLNLRPASCNYANIKRKIQTLNVDCSHWKNPRGWNKDKRLKNWSDYTSISRIKKHLVATRGNICEECKNTEWNNKPIVLEIHHNDGDRTNNNLDNLKLLCCNCHSQTDNWRGKSNKEFHSSSPEIDPTEKNTKLNQCLNCYNLINDKSKFCSVECSNKYNSSLRKQATKIEWPSYNDLINLVNSLGYSAAGRQLGVSDNAIRKHIKYLEQKEKDLF